MRKFKWNVEKNEQLAKQRGITFEEIMERIESGVKVFDTEHPNKKKYPNQRILIVELDGYAYMVPYVVDKDEFFLKTIIPSRKATKKYFGDKND
ncbi:MAG: toxin [Kiritimatiellae bacterium]|nr:toxin [Kiritimatiellia bacterium]